MIVVYQILSEVAAITLPFGFSFGTMIIFLWSIPMLLRFFKSIF